MKASVAAFDRAEVPTADVFVRLGINQLADRP